MCRLHALGASVGSRLVDSVYYRERNFRRETKIDAILYFIQVGVWKVRVIYFFDSMFLYYI